ncbi:MAG: hypothetical protein IJS09_01125 [Treponema sp.]|nr:hypothetical protein [Treponema sp.]
MQKRTRFKSPLRDALVVLLCMGTAAFFIFLFWKDLNHSSSRSDKDTIATITFKNRIAQRKFEDRVVWERVSQNAPLYDGDIIRTADLSSASIHFTDGTTLDLSENTMVQIYYSENGIQVAVGGGDIQVDSSAQSKVALKLDDGSTVNVDAGASLAAKSDASGAKSLEVKSGSAQITTESGSLAEISSGESVSVEKGGEITKRPLTITSVPKELRLLNIKHEPIPVKLEWKKADGSAAKVVVQTSRSKDFAKLESERKYTSSGSELKVDSGVMYWRVFAEDAKEMAVDGKITVEKIDRVQAQSPAEGGEYRYRTNAPRINFRWTGNNYADYYRFVVATTPDMRGNPVEMEVENTFVSLDNLEAGNYYWQVTPHYSLNNIGYEGASKPRGFTVVKSEQIRAPELSVPAANTQLTYRTTPSVNFAWKSEIKDASYTLLVAKDAQFNQVVLKKESKDVRLTQEFDGERAGDGTYYWKVVRKSSDPDDLTPESVVRSFTLAKYVPQENKLLYPPENFSAEQAKLAATQFMWKLGDDYKDGAIKSVLQISKSRNFASLEKESELSEPNSSNLILNEGVYYWRVGAKLADGTTEGFTAPRRFTVLRELGVPQYISPSEGAEVLAYNNSPVMISWNAVSGADYYNVRVYNKKDEVVAQNPSVKATRTSFVLPPDTYTCRVQAVAAESELSAQRAGAARTLAFSVREPSPVVLRLPVAATKVDGLSALRKPVVFTWQSGKDKADSYEFVLRKKQADGTSRVVERMRTGKKASASVERLTEGSYTWQVVASTADGFPVNSVMRDFIVEPVAELPRVTLVSPANKLVMDSVYLRKNRTIVFSWQQVEDATEYHFALYRRGPGKTLVPVMTERGVKGNTVRLKDLSVLDVGEFVWNVTAYSYAKDGFEERHSKAASSEFKISFDEPNKIQTITPGRMYAE